MDGEPEAVDEARAAQILAEEDLEILVDLGGGGDGTGVEEASYWFCDFSHEYGGAISHCGLYSLVGSKADIE